MSDRAIRRSCTSLLHNSPVVITSVGRRLPGTCRSSPVPPPFRGAGGARLHQQMRAGEPDLLRVLGDHHFAAHLDADLYPSVTSPFGRLPTYVGLKPEMLIAANGDRRIAITG